jgi:hypothetical protein
MRYDELLCNIISEYKSIREFARAIEEDPADIFRWKAGKRKINPRAVIKIVRRHPKIAAHDLNGDVFLKGMTFNFNGEGKN